MADPRPRVLMTGAAGNVGTTLWRAWEEEDRYDLTLADLRPVEGARSRTETGDVRDPGFMRGICRGQDVLVHLAFLRDKDGPDNGAPTDIGVSLALWETARKSGIGRIVYASTNKVTSGNRKEGGLSALQTPDQFNPESWYGAMKGMAEIGGRMMANAGGMSFIAIRIGTFSGQTEPDSLRACAYLLSPRDCVQLFRRAVDYSGPEKFIVTYGTSGNSRGSHRGPLDIGPAVEILGYEPEDDMMQFRSRFES
ncbi:MAG: NAD-dependent epimerase/dehydratase family protein [Gemmatimonadetes bacterium]|nr:NAD-dependent epimerase/dehydratase family protein [Gemmatimonadota bacterium]